MFYANPCYPDYFDAHDSSYKTQGQNPPYIDSPLDESGQHYLKKIVNKEDIYIKYDFMWINGNYNAWMDPTISYDGGKESYPLFSPYYSRAWFGVGKFKVNQWYTAIYHIYAEKIDSENKRIFIDIIIDDKQYHTRTDKTYLNPKVESFVLGGVQHIRNVIVADFPLCVNDKIVELPVSHAGDFIDKKDGTYELSTVDQTGTVNVDISSLEEENTKLIAISYISSITRNNEDITGVEVNYAGSKEVYSLQDGSNVVIQSINGDSINKDTLKQATITAKKV